MKIEEFKTERTTLLSKMLDNPEESGIYPTTEFFEGIDALAQRYANEREIILTDTELRDIPATGTCDICKKEEVKLNRTYFRYEDIKCECHSPYHFDLYDHCSDCTPKQPRETKITFRVSE